jgi:hypothetical protein
MAEGAGGLHWDSFKLGQIDPTRIHSYASIGMQNTETGERIHVEEFKTLRNADFGSTVPLPHAPVVDSIEVPDTPAVFARYAMPPLTDELIEQARHMPQEARKSLEFIASEFRAKAITFTDLTHVLIEAVSLDSAREARLSAESCFSGKLVWLFLESAHPKLHEGFHFPVHCFLSSDRARGREAFEYFWPLARTAVQVLTEIQVLDDIGVFAAMGSFGEKFHWCGRWMKYVHRLARMIPAGWLLRSDSYTCWTKGQIPPDAVAWDLSVGVFHASALVIERTLVEGGTLEASVARRPSLSTYSTPPKTEARTPETLASASLYPTQESTGPLVLLGQPGDEPRINGKLKPRLTHARYNIVKALLSAGGNGLTGDDLVIKSGHGGAVNTLKNLASSDPDWKSVILLPGRPGGRYRLAFKSDDH